MFQRRVKIIIIFFVLLNALTIAAQGGFTDGRQSLEFSQYSVNKGLSSNTVRALAQDKYGFIWIGTDRGLNRYDGHEMRTLNHAGGNISVYSLCADDDRIWVGTEYGLFYYSIPADTIIRFQSKNTDITSTVMDVVTDKKGRTWVGTMGQGAFIINNNGGVQQVLMPENGETVAKLVTDDKGRVWACSNWNKINFAQWDEKKGAFEGISSSTNVMGIAATFTKKGVLVIGSWNGDIFTYDPKSNKTEVVSRGVETKIHNIHSMEEVDPNRIMLGSDDGLAIIDLNSRDVNRFRHDELQSSSLSDQFVYPILKDREESLWIGTYYGGLNYTNKQMNNFVSHNHSDFRNSVGGHIINNFVEDSKGNVWIASDDGGLTKYDTAAKRFIQIDNIQGLSSKLNIHGLCIDGYNLYVGTYGQGIYIYNIINEGTQHIEHLKDDKDNNVDVSSYAMHTDSKGRVWIGTYNGIGEFDKQTRLIKNYKILGAIVYDIDEAKDGSVWAATDGAGLWRRGKNGKWRQYACVTRGNSNNGNKTSAKSMYIDRNGIMWVASSTGLYVYDKSADAFVPENVGGLNIDVMGVTGMGDDLWMTTSRGLIRYSTKEHKVLQMFHNTDFRGADFIPNAIYKTKDGRVLLGTTQGYLRFQPDAMYFNSLSPKVVFTKLQVSGKDVNVGADILPENICMTKELTLNYDQNSIAISFSAMSYQTTGIAQYRYWLEGFDNGWKEPSMLNNASYTNLEPGTYTFHVKASNNDGVWGEDETTLLITITPPFYWNTTAQIVYLLIICTIILYVEKRVIKKKETQHKNEIQMINSQKEQEIKEVNEQKEEEIKQINIQKEQEIKEVNEQKEQEIHDARIKFMTFSDKDNEFLNKLEHVIEQNFSNPDLSVDDLADNMNISRSGLFAKIKTLADVTPNEMIQIIRLKHAAALLKQKEYRVNEVCYMVGFSSPSYFSKCFQRMFGTTPAKFAK